MSQSLLPLSLYIHVPWCIKKCPYCDFNSHTFTGELNEKNYMSALLADLDESISCIEKRPLSSIFIGGGMPSLISATAYEFLFTEIKKRFSFKKEIEITLEANPGTVDNARFKDYFSVGINRLSLGIQSFDDNKLKALGRIHDSQKAIAGIESAIYAGFENFNLDIMHGLPGQSIDEAIDDITMALSFKPKHFSWYQLTIEPNTAFYKANVRLPGEKTLQAIETQGFEKLKAFHHYEISAFAMPGYESKHNLNYWTFGDYLGIGAGGHGKISDSKQNEIWRTVKKRQPQAYLKGPFLAKHHKLKEKDIIFEFMLNVLRLKQTIPFELFEQRTFLKKEVLEKPLLKAKKLLLLDFDEHGFYLTKKGKLFVNEAQALFL